MEKKELTRAVKCLFLHRGQKSCAGFPGGGQPGSLVGPVLCGASLGTGTATAQGPAPWASLEPPQFTAREELAHCHHMRDRE